MLYDLKKYMSAEYDAIGAMILDFDNSYEEILELLYNCSGKVVFMGVGKSGHIGEKLAATFSSTGTPSFFVHSTESVHGDLGMIQKNDIVILISNSGKTKEVLQTVAPLRAIGCKLIAFTSGQHSELVKACDYALVYPKTAEADHLNLAPTVSSTLTLVMGDAVACALSERRGFTKEDFYKFHPAGALGAKLNEQIKE